ncbi:cytochrome-c peroxidase [Myxococcus xanthus]|uniref:cytochrome-c peroxidase n=1 Tax=Myxococcus xanthus TaxID=34 RepID=UPI001F2C02AC|nr:cytochrome c peroxidase [Myxococcus xanthus]
MSPAAPRSMAAASLAWLLLGACGEGGPPPVEEGPFPRHLPVGMAVIPSPPDNPLTPEGIALGRWLFHSPRLSSNGQVSCATCHEQARAFADDAALTRRGVSGRPLVRHVPALINLAWMEGLFWDGGSKNLESLSLAPLTHPDEMGNSQLSSMMARLSSEPEFAQRFENAFGPDGLTLSNLLRALAQFQRTLVSADSRYDRWRRGEPGVSLSPQEQHGLALVQRHCATCHATELFTDNAYHNNGLDSDAAFGEGEAESRGRGRVTQRAEDAGRFKTPTLRNVPVTAPYMHDGRLATLEDVLEHYRGGMVPSTTLDAAFQRQGQAPGLSLDDTAKAAIISFLDALTDEGFLSERELATHNNP